MDSRDRRLGMDQGITRRDFLNGVGVAIGASLLPACGRNGDPLADPAAPYYPPAETGMRGSHPGSFEVAHATVQGQRWPAGETGEHYDLVVVGAGISGLASAYIYRRDIDPGARILVLDNHDDFGGHAKRNEFTVDGHMLLAFGGTMLIEAWKYYPDVAKQVMREIGIDADRHKEFYDYDLFDSLGLARASFLDRETFGADYLSVGSNGYTDAIDDAPLSASAKQEL